MTVERPADSTREPAFVDDAPLVFTDGAGGPPLPDPAEPPPEAWKSLLGRLVRSQKKFVKPSLVSQRPVEERPCAKCAKPVRVDLLSCPFCAHRFERLSREPVAMERVDGAVVPATLVREFAEQRDRDTVASRLERERRMGNRVRLTAIGVIMLVVPTIFIWFMIAPSHFLAPAIVAEAISAWIVMRTLLGARGGSMAASIAVTPGAAARLIAGMACAFAMEPSVQRPGELIMGTEGRGAAAVFAMIAGSVVLSYVLATLLGIGIEQAEDDYTAQQPRGPRTFKGALLEVIAGFKGAFMVGAPDVLQPRARAAQPQPIAALGAGIHPGRLAPLEESTPLATEDEARRRENHRVLALSSVAFLAGPGVLYWVLILVPFPWLLVPILIELATMGVVARKVVPGHARLLAIGFGLARIAAGITVCVETHHPLIACGALVLGLVVLKMNDLVTKALDKGT